MANTVSFLLLISGPSGAGKGTVYCEVMDRNPRLRLSISCTTRRPRPDEQDGREYHFLDQGEFRRLIDEDAFAEHAEVHDELYGTRSSDIDAMLELGEIPLLDIDVQGGVKVLDRYKKRVVSVFLFPPSWEVLEQRLRNRGTESDEQLDTRLANARWEVEYAQHYEYWLINDDLAATANTLGAIVVAEGQRRERWREFPLSP